jgi:hypothetical protein
MKTAYLNSRPGCAAHLTPGRRFRTRFHSVGIFGTFYFNVQRRRLFWWSSVGAPLTESQAEAVVRRLEAESR